MNKITRSRYDQLLKERNGMLPVWIRASNQGPEFFTGLSRAKLYQLFKGGHIKTRSVREPGKERGCRLFDLKSILDYIESAECETGTGGGGRVYFIEAVGSGRVKIGFTQGDPKQRLSDLQVGSHDELRVVRVIEDANQDDERRIHGRFSKLRRNGEWFELQGELAEFIGVESKAG